jgi:hypothetical protein
LIVALPKVQKRDARAMPVGMLKSLIVVLLGRLMVVLGILDYQGVLFDG